ncbi:hypothetical protein PR003_g27740 [Phytophthora rubi]|uniref:Uncharacterized protein n=1 Tax=Phytophthora rubi TaxID=129364 RepID=A0A6A4BZG4_9STRA|nr:hypothetical protein PR003_g27740 [Phytophthora rubi]
MPGVFLEEVLQNVQKSWQRRPGPWVRAKAATRSAQSEPQAPTSYDYSGSPATFPGTGTDRYARGASVVSQHGSRGRPHYQADAVEPAAGVVSDQDAQCRATGSRSDPEIVLVDVESCQRLLDGQRTEMVALRARVQDVEARLERLQNVRRDMNFLPDRV